MSNSGARDIAGAGGASQSKTAPTPVNTPLNNAPISQGLSRPTVPETIDEDADMADDVEEGAADPTAQAIYNLVSGRLAGLVGRSSGYVESLPPSVKRRVEGLKGVQDKQTELEAKLKREMFELEKKYLELYTPLYERRRAILAGDAEPTDEEVAAGEAITAEDKEEGGRMKMTNLPKEVKEPDTPTKGIPQFWLTALRNHIELQQLITERDEEALASLIDVKLEYITEPALGYKLTFVFEENSFFENKELTKSYYYQKELGYGGEYMYARAEGTKIKWKEEKDLTKTVEIKKQRNKNTNRTRLVRRTQAVPSFFDFFSPPVPPSSDPELIEAGFAVDGDELEEKELEELEEKLELDYQLGEDFKEKIIPRAVDFFTGKALRFEPQFSDVEEEESDEDEDEDDSDSDAGQPRRAPAAPKKKAEAEKAEECKNHVFPKMIDELRSASNRLRAALDHYVRICSQVQDVCLQGLDPENVTSDYIEQVDRELGLIESYDVKMQLAKTAIKVTRNYALDAVPINRFPIELLGRIFEMARDVEPRCIDEVVLVCSRWRNIALAIPSLWTRIDLHPSLCKSFYPSLNRAQYLPLDPNGLCTTEGYHENSMVGLCAVAAPRVGSLELNLQEFNLNDLSNANYPAIASLFLKCSPGSFTKIVTSCGFFGFFVPDREQTNAGMWTMKLPVEHAHLETVLASVNVLDLTGLYPPWTSRAYHDLVELRLIGSSVGQSSIPEWQLINILKSSPKLRVLLSNINVTSRIAEYLDVSVSLPDLEMLQVDAEPVQENKFGHLELVRFIVPGPRPLNLVLQCADMQLSESSWEHTKAFLERANVEKLYLDSVRHPLSILPQPLTSRP
ncbi:nucleosome assembly protein (NAP) family [Rhizoctonia solani]|uniref:Nucleosome assembly protein (NAP) family n=1 Tax=Rhizoctonia solani TaxID=456999 RepID=A0A8H7I9E2_9AGAM|nr:nucleosome assembly protein (NAP) family [Rhizoctonia solani]